MLFYTKTTLDLISDIDMLLFLEDGIRGGVSYACERYSEKDSKSGREKDEPNFLYLDANNLVSRFNLTIYSVCISFNRAISVYKIGKYTQGIVIL